MKADVVFESMQSLPDPRHPNGTVHASELHFQELRRQVSGLREIRSVTAHKSGRDFFQALAAHLARTIQVDIVLIVEAADGDRDRARTLVAWNGDGLAPDFEFTLAGTPGAGAMGGQPCYFPHSAQELFPADGRLRRAGAVACACVPLRGPDGAPLGFIEVQHRHPRPESEGAAAMDILSVFADQAGGELERLKMRAALRESDQRFRAITEGTSDLILIVGVDGRISYANPSAQQAGGYDSRELHGRFISEFVHPDDLATVRSSLEDVAKTPGHAPAFECRLRLKSGSWIQLEAQGNALLSDPLVGGIIINARNIADRRTAKNLEARLLHAQRLDTVGFVASGIAHEFCNLLLPVQLGVGMVRMELPLDHPLQVQLDSVELAADRARDLARHLLTLGRSQPAIEEWVDLEPVVSAGVKLLRASLPSSVLINLRYSARLPGVVANPIQIQQALLNLGINSWQAMPYESGTIDITLDAIVFPSEAIPPAPEMQPGKYLRLAFSDDGQGIAPHLLPRIFEPFFTTKPAGKGTGLGLATLKTIVDSHRGFTTVESEVGHGTTFCIYFPAAIRA